MRPTKVALLDVNVLVALCLQEHIHHRVVNDWWALVPNRPWASCAITELGFMRVAMNAKINAEPLSIVAALEVVEKLKTLGAHTYWHDLNAPESYDLLRAQSAPIGYRQTTDLYLLSVAKARGGMLATLDRGIVGLAGRENKSVCELIG